MKTERKMDSCVPIYEPRTGCCKRGNEHLGYSKDGELYEYLGNQQLLDDCPSWG
jgi:hypothetical protein